MGMNSKRYGLIIAAVFLSLLTAGCERKTINDLKAEPDRYANKEVALVGEVVRSFSVLGRGAYEIDDGTGRIWIVSEKGVPRRGAQVVVKGRIRDAYDLSSFVKLPEPVRSGMVMIEILHRSR
jgi:membrane protein implicated in regulation of membrane protease activity